MKALLPVTGRIYVYILCQISALCLWFCVSSKPQVSRASSYLMFQRIRSVKKILNYLVKEKTGLWWFNKLSKDLTSKQLALMLSIPELLTPGHQRIKKILFSKEKHWLRVGFSFLFYYYYFHKRHLWFTANTRKIAPINKLYHDSICSLWGEVLLATCIFTTCYKRDAICTCWHWTLITVN